MGFVGLMDQYSAAGFSNRPGSRVRRDAGALSTTVVQPDATTSWKQEVSLRIAAHKSRKGWSPEPPVAPTHNWGAASSRAAQAAARVAARYAQAPSFSQMQMAVAQIAPPAVQAPEEAPVAESAATEALQKEAVAGPHLWEPQAPHSVETARPSVRDWEPAVPAAIASAPFAGELGERAFAQS